MQNQKGTNKLVQHIVLFALTLFFASIVFVVDTKLPLGVAAGALYTVVVLFSWLLQGRYDTLIIASICTVLVIVGYIESPVPDHDIEMAKINRVISFVLIWVCTVLVILAKKGFSGMARALENLEEKIDDRTKMLRRSREKLIESEQLYRYLYENANEMYVSIDPIDATIIKCNDTLCRRTGYTKDEIIGRDMYFLYHPDCHAAAKKSFHEFEKTKLKGGVDRSIRTKDGEKIDVILNVSAATDEEGNILYYRSSWIDVTAYKQSQKALEERSKMLEIQNKELEQFVYIASHDLQEPLRTVSSFTQLLNKEYAQLFDEKGKKSMDFILQAVGRMKELITGLLHYGLIGKDRKIEAVNIREIIDEIENDINSLIEDTNASIEVHKLPKKINAQHTEMHQLFQNLICNAIKFRKPNVDPKISISCESKKGHYQFSVKDNGIGIEENHRERIFKIFQRLHDRNSYEGTGIGLAHCKKITDLHKGAIWVESELDKGSTFYFTIPK